MPPMIGPFFYINGVFLTAKIPASQGEKRGGKVDNPCSHEKLYDDNYSDGDYINFPRGRVVWDIEKDRAIVYVDACIERINDAIAKIADLFSLNSYVVEHDEHYVCVNCIQNIWEE